MADAVKRERIPSQHYDEHPTPGGSGIAEMYSATKHRKLRLVVSDASSQNPADQILSEWAHYIVAASTGNEGQTMPKVEIATVGMAASAIVAAVCLFSLFVWWITGFYLIYPAFAVLIGAGAALIYAVNAWIHREWHRDD